MAYPTLTPSARNYGIGQYAVTTVSAQNGSELRILRGPNTFGGSLELEYQSIPDAEAAEFIDHYREVYGTYLTFSLPTGPKGGWSQHPDYMEAPGCDWRYAEQPTITSMFPGISTVRVRLVLALHN